MAIGTETYERTQTSGRGVQGDSRETRLSAAATLGSVVSAFMASACCVGPLLFALLGLGGAGLLVQFEPYRPYFIVLTAALLSTGFYLTYRKSKAVIAAGAEGDACACPAPRTGRAGRVTLWVATILVAMLLAFPYITAAIWG